MKKMCELDTFIGREPVYDADGDPTGKQEVVAQCNGGYANDCGWRRVLYGADGVIADEWWVTNTVMQRMHAAHQTGENS